MVQQSQHSAHVFIIHNKEGTVMFILNYHRLNQKLVRNHDLFTSIDNKIHHLEGFQYEN